MKKHKKVIWLLSFGIVILLTGCVRKEETDCFKSRIRKEECIFCGEEKSVFREEGILLGMCNVNTGEVIDLLLGNEQNSGKLREKGRKELHFGEEDATTLRLFSLKGRDVCEVSLYLGEKSRARRKAGNLLCQDCVELAQEGVSEYVLIDYQNHEVYALRENCRLMFAGDYGLHMDWDEEQQKLDIFVFYAADDGVLHG